MPSRVGAAPGAKKRRRGPGLVSTLVRVVLTVAATAALLAVLGARISADTGIRRIPGAWAALADDPRVIAWLVVATLVAPVLATLLRASNLLFPGERGLLAIAGSMLGGVAAAFGASAAAMGLGCVLSRLAATGVPIAQAVKVVEWGGCGAEVSVAVLQAQAPAIAAVGAVLGIATAVLAPRRR